MLHAIVTAGVFSEDGDFMRIREFPTAAIEEVFRKLLLTRLHQAQRLSESFMVSLLSWVHSGFSVYAKHRIEAGDSENLEKLARYATRAPIRLTSIEITASGKVSVATPRDHRTGKTSLVLDPVEFIHQVANQIPDPRMHMVRYYGVYANRVRKDYAECSSVGIACDDDLDDLSVGEKKSRASWARLIRKIFEVDPLLCPNCHVAMKIVAVITEPQVIDKILNHQSRSGNKDVFEPRAPPSVLH